MKKFLTGLVAAFTMALLPQAGMAMGTSQTGTFKNPILPGFHPDPSIVRVGDWFYITNSTFEWHPGLPIHRSKDLVHWELIGNALERNSQNPLRGATDSGGNYAPTIRHGRGKFYITCTNFNGKGAYIISAENPAGPWSEPLWLNDWQMDASLLFDDDGKVYYTKHAGGAHGGISQAEINPDTGKFLTPFKVIYNNKNESWNEGPHLYKINGMYYLMLAEGGTGPQHQAVIGRSKSPWGPFEPCPHNPILTHRDRPEDPIQATGHADLVEAGDGSWWMVFLAVRPETGVALLGRETFLAPVEWENGWPVVNGNGRVQMTMKSPRLKPHAFQAPPARQNFDNEKLGPEWIHPRNPVARDYSLSARRGWLRIRASKAGLSNKEGSPAFAGRRQSSYRQAVRTYMQFLPQGPGEEAGLSVRTNDDNHYEIGVELQDGVPSVFHRETVQGNTFTTGWAPLKGAGVFLEIAVDGDAYAFSYSTDGKRWSRLAASPSVDLSKDRAMGYTGTAFGLYASANGEESTAHADFDWWELSDGGQIKNPVFSPRPTPTPLPARTTWRINTAGNTFKDAQGQSWDADTGFQGGSTAGTDEPISQTQDDELFQSERWAPDMAYHLPVVPGSYRVNLRFAEIYMDKAESRVFSVDINGRPVLKDFDIFKAAGGKNRAIDKTFGGIKPNAEGLIVLRFYSTIDNAKISAIEVIAE